MRMHGAKLHILAALPGLTALPLAGRKTVLSLSLNRATGVQAARPVPWAPAGPARSMHLQQGHKAIWPCPVKCCWNFCSRACSPASSWACSRRRVHKRSDLRQCFSRPGVSSTGSYLLKCRPSGVSCSRHHRWLWLCGAQYLIMYRVGGAVQHGSPGQQLSWL